jgi:23S rRNA (uracil1939-C5)-methyltransferase
VETLAGASLETEPNTFFQVNPAQAENVVRCMEQVLGAGSRGLLVDLYAGVGALSVPLASRFRAVVAIESVRSACRLATRNAGRNGLPDYRVVCGDAGGMLARVLRERSGGAAGTDVLIADPPRSGMPPSVTRQVARSGIPLVLYLSCDPRTQARDLVHLGDTYRLRRIVPFDMFPHTFHVECLAVLERLPR